MQGTTLQKRGCERNGGSAPSAGRLCGSQRHVEVWACTETLCWGPLSPAAVLAELRSDHQQPPPDTCVQAHTHWACMCVPRKLITSSQRRPGWPKLGASVGGGHAWTQWTRGFIPVLHPRSPVGATPAAAHSAGPAQLRSLKTCGPKLSLGVSRTAPTEGTEWLSTELHPRWDQRPLPSDQTLWQAPRVHPPNLPRDPTILTQGSALNNKSLVDTPCAHGPSTFKAKPTPTWCLTGTQNTFQLFLGK